MSRGRRVLLAVAGGVLLVFVLMAVAPQLFTHGDPLVTDFSASRRPPSGEHWLGTDQSGRDIYTRLVYGARQSLGVGLLATLGAVVLGLLLGVCIGLLPRGIESIVMRVVDILLAIPEFLVALVVVALLGPGPWNVALAVMIAVTPIYLRLARGHTRQLRGAEHVEAARMLGETSWTVARRHIVPNVLRRLTVLATIGVGTSILAVAGLSFLGLGVSEPNPEWGLILFGGRNELARAWWISLFPGLAITITVVAASLLGRTLRTRVEEGASG